MEVQGKVKLIKDVQEVSASFKKRELVVTTAEQYPQDILIEFVQDKTDLLNALKVGDMVTVQINLRGREWINPQGEAKYFNSLHGWRVSSGEGTSAPLPPKGEDVAIVEGEDDLPF